MTHSTESLVNLQISQSSSAAKTKLFDLPHTIDLLLNHNHVKHFHL